MNSTESSQIFEAYVQSPKEQRLMRRKEQMKLKYRLAKIIRVATVAPVLAAILIGLLYFLRPGSYANALHAWLAVVFLSILPVLAYPVSHLIPAIHRKGRDGQRSLAIVFSVIGYILGCVVSFGFGAAPVEKLIYLTYLSSGALIAIFSGVFHIKASGHACGVVGPIFGLCYCVSPWFAFAGILYAAVIWSSLKLKRHTLSQLILGAVFPVASMLIFAAFLGL